MLRAAVTSATAAGVRNFISDPLAYSTVSLETPDNVLRLVVKKKLAVCLSLSLTIRSRISITVVVPPSIPRRVICEEFADDRASRSGSGVDAASDMLLMFIAIA